MARRCTNMVVLPKGFVSTKYPGYFWNTEEERLYSVKVYGALKPMVMQKPNMWNYGQALYQVSVGGKKRYLYLNDLKKLKPKRETYPIWNQTELF